MNSMIDKSRNKHNNGDLLPRLHCSCLPSSTALSPNAHAKFDIRSFHTNIHPSKLVESAALRRNNHVHDGFDMKLYVSAQFLGIGSIPLHSSVDSIGSSSILAAETNHNRIRPTMEIDNRFLPSYNVSFDHYCRIKSTKIPQQPL
jgi:hypothetical protein